MEYRVKVCGKAHAFCKVCRPDVVKSMSGRPTSEYTRRKLSYAISGQPQPDRGREGRIQSSETRLKIGDKVKKHMELCADPSCSRMVCNPYNRVTNIEKTLRSWFPDGAPETRVGYRRIDVALVEDHIALEADGSHWHDPFFSNEKDVLRDTYLVKHGWFVLRFSERTLSVGDSLR